MEPISFFSFLVGVCVKLWDPPANLLVTACSDHPIENETISHRCVFSIFLDAVKWSGTDLRPSKLGRLEEQLGEMGNKLYCRWPEACWPLCLMLGPFDIWRTSVVFWAQQSLDSLWNPMKMWPQYELSRKDAWWTESPAAAVGWGCSCLSDGGFQNRRVWFSVWCRCQLGWVLKADQVKVRQSTKSQVCWSKIQCGFHCFSIGFLRSFLLDTLLRFLRWEAQRGPTSMRPMPFFLPRCRSVAAGSSWRGHRGRQGGARSMIHQLFFQKFPMQCESCKAIISFPKSLWNLCVLDSNINIEIELDINLRIKSYFWADAHGPLRRIPRSVGLKAIEWGPASERYSLGFSEHICWK